ncbi:PGF-pre-PGF domain-containing protein [Candidatus Woesearchaeota archaeon]|nr:PGF-pre-PGF domain-containing protein [Candidatus Woesearchaeota archaeon]
MDYQLVGGMMRNTLKVLVLAALALAALSGASAQVPVPQGISGTVFDLDGITQVPAGTNYSVNNTANGFFFQGRTGGGYSTGRYAAAVAGNAGDTVVIRAWNRDHESTRSVQLNGVLKNVNLLLNLTLENSAPRIVSIPPAAAIEDEMYSYQASAEDDEGDAVSFTLLLGPPGMAITGGLLTWLPENDDVGPHGVSIRVSDTALASTQNFTVTVSNVNDAPEIYTIPPTDAIEDQPFSYQVGASDVDSALSYSLSETPEGMAINSSGYLSWLPTNGDVGLHNVTVRVSDGELEDLQSFQVTVSNVNDAPYFTSTPPDSLLQEEELNYPLAAVDVDSFPLTFSLVEAPGGMALNGSVLQWTPENQDVGLHNITLQVTDGEFNDSQRFVLLVVNVNDPPAFTTTPVGSVLEGQEYRYQADGTDPDSDELAFALQSGPSGMAVEASSGMVSWHPVHRDVGHHTVEILLTDGNLTALQSYQLTVQERSSGGGGGGGGGIPGRPPRRLHNLTASFSGMVRRVALHAYASAEPSIDVEELPGRPRAAGSRLPGPVYGYLSISLLPSEEEPRAERVTVDFSVPLSWLASLNVSSSEVRLFHYDGQWEALPTTPLGERDDLALFRAEAPSLSYFAIGLAGPIPEPERLMGDVVVVAPPVNSVSIGGIIYARNGRQVRRGTLFAVENPETGECVEGRTGIAKDTGRFSAMLQASEGDMLHVFVDRKEVLTLPALEDEDLDVHTSLRQGLSFTGLAIAVQQRPSLVPGSLALALLVAIGALLAMRVRLRRE